MSTFLHVHVLIIIPLLYFVPSFDAQDRIIKLLPSEKVIVDEGDNVTLTCIYESKTYTATWYNKDGEILHDRIKTANTTYARFRNISWLEKGSYTCVLLRNKATINIQVNRKAKLYVEQTNAPKKVVVNTNISIPLKLEGSPMPSLSCKGKDGTKVISCSSTEMKNIMYKNPSHPCTSGDGHYQIQSKFVQKRDVLFKIYNATFAKDDGLISCNWRNNRYEQNFSLAIKVIDLDRVISTQKIILFTTQATMSGNPSSGGINKTSVIIGTAVACALLLGLAVMVGLVFYRRERRLKNKFRAFLKSSHLVDPTKYLNEQMHNLSYDKDWVFPGKLLVISEEELGSGAFGSVYKGQAYGIDLFHPRDKSRQAVKQRKQISKCSIKAGLNCSITVAVKSFKARASPDEIRDFVGELKLMMHIGEHQNIVNLLGVCHKGYHLYGILEFCKHGNLREFLRSKRAVFEPSWVKTNYDDNEEFTTADQVTIARDITEGMKFLVSQKCIHRDLAARNILLGENFVVKVADFGIARNIDENYIYTASPNRLLPFKWMALESLIERKFSKETDVWSFGILLWEITTLGGVPYPNLSVEEVKPYLSSGGRLEQPDHCIQELYTIMMDCWHQKPKERPSFESLSQQLSDLLSVNEVSSTDLDRTAEQSHLEVTQARSREINQRHPSQGSYVNVGEQETLL